MQILKVDTERRRIGNLGERAAARYLRKNGYKILSRNFVAEGKEIDIIAIDKENLVFCEVKARTEDSSSLSKAEPRPASAVTPKKQMGIIDAARAFLRTRGNLGRHIRFDCIEVYLTKHRLTRRVNRIVHMKAAFNLDTARSRK